MFLSSPGADDLANRIVGSDISNDLHGDVGNDTLLGYAGNDTLSGGLNNDLLIGGQGSDVFVFDTVPDNFLNTDIIRDFAGSGVDTAALDNSIYIDVGPAGTLAGNRFFTGAGAHDLDDRIIYNPSTGALLYDGDGSAGEGATHFASLRPHLALTAADFLIL